MGRYLLGGLVLGILFVGQVQALTELTIDVGYDGSATLNGRVVPNALHIDTHQETLLIPLVEATDRPDSVTMATLHLPFTMPADWQPRLIPSRCSCETTVTRLDATSFSLSTSGLIPGAQLSLQAVFQPNTFRLSAGQRAILGAESLSPWLLGVAATILLGTLGLLGWMIYELAEMRKFKLTPTLTPTPPNDLSPSYISLLPSGKMTAATIGAMLFGLASRGFFRIEWEKDHFDLIETHQLDLTGPGFALGSFPGDAIPFEELEKAKHEHITMAEKYLMSKLFTQEHPDASQTDLKQRIGHHLSSWKIGKVYAETYKGVAQNGLFIRNPHEIHLKYRGIGIAIFFVGLVGFVGSFWLPGSVLLLELAWALVALCGFTVTRMVPFLPLLTVMGQAEWSHWSGFRLFLADPKPLDASYPAELFFKYLPYAVAFGELKQWAARFGSRPIDPPRWYVSDVTPRTADVFLHELSRLFDQVAVALAAVHEHTVL